MFFEGSEKKFELSLVADADFRQFDDQFWAGIVAKADAQILSKIENEHCKSYLLSESSLFVYDRHMVMLTCGRTNLINAVEAVFEKINLDQVATFFYERKHEFFPRKQPTSFTDDVERLAELMPGKAYRFGSEADHYIQLFHLDRRYTPESNDLTLEILMHGVKGQAVELFDGGLQGNKKELCLATGVHNILPDFEIDEHFFDPCGYSLNAIKDDDYYTIHVTPQETGSYVSFETNYDYRSQKNVDQLIKRVVEIFQPGSVDIMLFEPTEMESPLLENYHLCRQVRQNLDCGYSVAFSSFIEPVVSPTKAHPIKISTKRGAHE